MFCQNCGKEMSTNDNYCSRCGAIAGQYAVPTDDSIAFFIPKNTWALWAYYLGVLSLLCGLLAGIPAVLAGIKGVLFARQNPEAKGAIHAWSGIILGGAMFFINLLFISLVIVSH